MFRASFLAQIYMLGCNELCPPYCSWLSLILTTNKMTLKRPFVSGCEGQAKERHPVCTGDLDDAMTESKAKRSRADRNKKDFMNITDTICRNVWSWWSKVLPAFSGANLSMIWCRTILKADGDSTCRTHTFRISCVPPYYTHYPLYNQHFLKIKDNEMRILI